MTFFAISAFRPIDRKIRPKYFGQVHRNFGRNFGFGRTLLHVNYISLHPWSQLVSFLTLIMTKPFLRMLQLIRGIWISKYTFVFFGVYDVQLCIHDVRNTVGAKMFCVFFFSLQRNKEFLVKNFFNDLCILDWDKCNRF